MKEMIDVCEGKYVLEFNADTGEFIAFRHGECWRDLTGDKFIFALFTEIQVLRKIKNGYPQWVKYQDFIPKSSDSKENAPYYTVKTAEHGNTQAMFVNGEWWCSQFSKITDCVVAWLREDENVPIFKVIGSDCIGFVERTVTLSVSKNRKNRDSGCLLCTVDHQDNFANTEAIAETILSLNEALSQAHGIPLNMRQIKTTTLFDFIKLNAVNGIRFVYEQGEK